MLWNPAVHSDQENLAWSWLRAVEWGRWPLFISQPIAPVLLVFVPWTYVLVGAVAANLLWAFFVRYNFVSPPLASLAVVLAKPKWIACPACSLPLCHETKRPRRSRAPLATRHLSTWGCPNYANRANPENVHASAWL